jgi:hypothetical protein
MRFSNVSKEKNNGMFFTPKDMADFLAKEMLSYYSENLLQKSKIKVLDPAAGDGELLLAMIRVIRNKTLCPITVVGYETDSVNAANINNRINQEFRNIDIIIKNTNFITDNSKDKFDFIIANPPYIRTQILGSEKSQELAKKMKLSGRVDLYYAFLTLTKDFLQDNGIAGYITSNKFLTIKSGMSVRNFILENYKLHEIIDFGDTKIFSAAVLPCITVFSKGKTNNAEEVRFSSVYESKEVATEEIKDSFYNYIHKKGIFTFGGKNYCFKTGSLQDTNKNSLWTISSTENNDWLKIVEDNTWLYFKDIGKVKVGIKTTADNVFIGDNWTGEKSDIELLRPLITHRDAGQIIAGKTNHWQVLYPHTIINGKITALDIEKYPKTKLYLYKHFEQLSSRNYLLKAHRNWYEIWVPQNPNAWSNRKIVFRDISEKPQFWLDDTGSIVNGDCYWLDINENTMDDTIYLALAVANSSFIE